jgi:drug/metabolite transporter (DMT)-like permease
MRPAWEIAICVAMGLFGIDGAGMGSASGMGLVLLAALGWGGLDAVRKRLASSMAPEAIVVWLCLGQVSVFAAVVAYEGAPWPDAGYALPACAAVGLNLVANLVYLQALRLSPLSVTVPLLALSPAFAALSAFTLLGERLSVEEWSGLGLVIVGALLLTRRPGVRLLRALREEPGSPRMVLVAALLATATTVDKVALEHASVGVHALVVSGGVGASALVFLAARGRLGALRFERGSGRFGLLLVALGSLAYGAQLAAVRWVYVGLLEATKRAVGTSMAFLVGHAAFGERPAASQWAAMVLLVGGVILLVV